LQLRTESLSTSENFNPSVDPLEVVPFSTENTGEFESHYYSLETVDGTTVAVPINITPGTTFDVSTSRAVASNAGDGEPDLLKSSTE